MNITKVGEAFSTLVVVSRALGHEDVSWTAREYLLPYFAKQEPGVLEPEMRWVLEAVARWMNGAPDESAVLTELLNLFPMSMLPSLPG